MVSKDFDALKKIHFNAKKMLRLILIKNGINVTLLRDITFFNSTLVYNRIKIFNNITEILYLKFKLKDSKTLFKIIFHKAFLPTLKVKKRILLKKLI